MCSVLNNAPAVRDRVYSEIGNQARARGLGQPQQSQTPSVPQATQAPQATASSLVTDAVSATSPAKQKRTKLRGVSGLTIPTESSGVNVPT
jgi:hypothetical protein